MTWPLVALLDRDGVLNANRPGYVTEPEHWQWLPGALDACARISAMGVRIAVLTNQAAVGRGLLSEAGLRRIHHHMVRCLADAGVPEPLVLHCPHLPEDGCACRKPRPGMPLEAVRRLGVRARECVLVGDHVSDLRAAAGAGCWSVHVRCGRGGPPRDPLPRYLGSTRDLASAIDLLSLPQRWSEPGTSQDRRRP